MSPSARPMENVWNYPRPPALQKVPSRLRVIWVHPSGQETTIADTTHGYRVLETSHPPTYYFPPAALLHPATVRHSSARRTFCEWKGQATYHDLLLPISNTLDKDVGSESSPQTVVAAKARIWSYPSPSERFRAIQDHLCFYCSSRSDSAKVGEWKCLVDEDVATAQEGDFYGSWITPEITGGTKGFKGGKLKVPDKPKVSKSSMLSRTPQAELVESLPTAHTPKLLAPGGGDVAVICLCIGLVY